MSIGKELKIREAIIHMMDGGICCRYEGADQWLYRYNDYDFQAKKTIDGEWADININGYFCDFNEYIESEEIAEIPEVIEGVGKVAINRHNHKIQGIVYRNISGFFVMGSIYQYDTIEDLKKEWYIIYI